MAKSAIWFRVQEMCHFDHAYENVFMQLNHFVDSIKINLFGEFNQKNFFIINRDIFFIASL